LSQCCKLKELQHFWQLWQDDYTTKQVTLEGGKEKERREIMVEKLNYGDRGVLAATSNTKVLRK
jgi:hypothetical protein